MKKYYSLFLLIFVIKAYSQTELVFVFFNDKPNKAVFYANPLSELTQKSLNRRTALGIPLNDQDAPIEPTFIQNVQNLGFTVIDYSKWLNGVAVNANAAQVTTLLAQPYVSSVESFSRNSAVVTRTNTQQLHNKFANTENLQTIFNYGNGGAQIDQVNLRTLHLAGYTGTGVSVAVIDTGFPTVNTGSAFARIRNNNQIKAGYNFVSKNADIYNTSLNNHGSVVLGAIAGYIENVFVGSAPDADFYLYVSENGSVEIPEEQLYWIMAAEEADRKGVDVINTSLGYSVFDDPRYNYTYADMNGITSFIARGSQIASEKGMVVVVANGNSGNTAWHYLLTPADNQKVFSIGAADNAGNASTFTSYGPNSANIIKPDASARGTLTQTVYDGSLISSNGTSLSSPIAAGGIACVIQAFPNINRETLKNQLRATASLYPNPSAQLGYGILNFGSMLNSVLSNSEIVKKKNYSIFPNPTSDILNVTYNGEIKYVEIYDNLGRMLFKSFDKSISVADFTKGVYYIKIVTPEQTFFDKFIKK